MTYINFCKSTAARQKHTYIARSYVNEVAGLGDFKHHFENAKDILQPNLEGLWRSQRGSLYKSDGEQFVCVTVHSIAYIGWINKIAIKDIQKIGSSWIGLQAFRDPGSGTLNCWEEINLDITEHKIIKYFPRSIPANLLLYGHTEYYDRVYQ